MQGPLEQRVEPRAEPSTLPPAPTAPSAAPSYRLATDVPSNWIPLLPQRFPGPPSSLRLVRAAVLAPDGTNAIRRARSMLLRAIPQLALYDEEIPREGVKVTRQFQASRWIGGSTHLWLGLRKQVGKGEGTSALRFDSVDPPEG